MKNEVFSATRRFVKKAEFIGFCQKCKHKIAYFETGADLGGDEGADVFFLSAIRPPADPKCFFGQNVLKSAYKRLFWPVFQNLACGAENFRPKQRLFETKTARKINSVDLKYMVNKIFENF